MKIEKVHEEIRYTLSNDKLKEGDEVYPIAFGRQTDDGWILHNLEWKEITSDFPRFPHIVKGIDVSPRETIIRTNYGYSHAPCYYKIIKVERQVLLSESPYARWEWQVFDKSELNITPKDPNNLPF